MNQPSIGPVYNGCLCCPPKPETPPMDWMPHPGFGALTLTRDGQIPDGWYEYCDLGRWTTYVGQGWTKLTIKAGPRKGQVVDHWDGGESFERPSDYVTLGDIEAACAEDPGHDWRLRIDGPMGGAIYQRQGCAQWVAIERLEGFA